MIVFLRVPGFYAAVEQADHGEDRGRPVLVGGDPDKGAPVVSASEEARLASVVEGMPLGEALRLCPTAVLRPTRLPRYREVAAELRAMSVPVTWLGARGGMEATLVPNQQIEFEAIDTQGLRGKGLGGWLRAPFRLLRAMWQARAVLRRVQPRA